jgi:serine/threonine-protein kinase
MVAGRFRVEEEIGRGGMGVVLRGRDTDNRAIAIKVLLPEAIAHPEAVPRFMSEAQAAQELTSAHSVRVYDHGTLESGLPFMVMELLEGQDLASVIEKSGPMSPADASDAIIDACDALSEAHSRGMVHRDLKPANLFAVRGADGRTRVKVLDFGVSKVASHIRQLALTSTGTILGSPHYMAPEQLRSAKGADARADTWSLGVVIYEMLTGGQMPFDGRSFGELFMQIVSKEPIPLDSVRPDVPPGLAAVVVRCMKRERDERYADMKELVAALAPFASPAGAEAARRILAGEKAGPIEVPAPAKAAARPALGGTMLMADSPYGSEGAIAAARAQVAKVVANQSARMVAAAPVRDSVPAPGYGSEPSQQTGPHSAPPPARAPRTSAPPAAPASLPPPAPLTPSAAPASPARLSSRSMTMIVIAVAAVVAMSVATVIGWVLFRTPPH